MGKKKPQKTKELSVAIAEASSTPGDETQQQQAQAQTPRKRGRPRKIVEKIESEENKEPTAAEAPGEVTENQSRKVTTSEKEEQQEVKTEASSALASMEGSTEKAVKREAPAPRSRARRKSKPIKSS